MTIKSVFINVADIETSVNFYKKHLGLEPVTVTADTAVLDAVTATITLARVDEHRDSGWIPDDQQRGFRHVGFKVSDLNTRAEVLKADGVRFHIEPRDAVGETRLTFFYDPDGTLIEFVQGACQYHEVFDQDLVDEDWALSAPERPRFDHVGETSEDPVATHAYWEPMGFRLMAGYHLVERDFKITYMRGGDTLLEVFEYTNADTFPREPRVDTLGFVAIEHGGVAPDGSVPIGTAFGHPLYSDPNGLAYADSH